MKMGSTGFRSPRSAIWGILLTTLIAGAASARWTILLYSFSDNNLESPQLDNLRDALEAMGKTDAASGPDFFTMVDRWQGKGDDQDGSDLFHTPWTNAYDLLLQPGGNIQILRDWGEPNQSTPSSLSDFIKRGLKVFPPSPDRKYLLVLNDHGGAFSGNGEDDHPDSNSPVVPNTYHGVMPIRDIRSGILDGLQGSGLSKFDMVAFDSCLMANIEVMQMLAPTTNYLVLSELVEPGWGWDWSQLVTSAAQSDLSPADLGKAMVDGFVAYCNKFTEYGYKSACTLGTYDMSQINEVTNALSSLVTAADKALTASPRDVAEALVRTANTKRALVFGSGYEPLTDLFNYLAVVADSSSGLPEDVRAAAAAVSAAASKLQVYYKKHLARSDTLGISAWVPRTQSDNSFASALLSWSVTETPVVKQWLGLWTDVQKAYGGSGSRRMLQAGGQDSIAAAVAAAVPVLTRNTTNVPTGGVPPYTVTVTLPRNVSDSLVPYPGDTGSALGFGWLADDGSRLMAGYVDMARDDASSPSTTTLAGTWDGMFYAAVQQINGSSGPMAGSVIFFDQYQESTTPDGQLLKQWSFDVAYAPSCDADYDTYEQALLQAYQLGNGTMTMSLTTGGTLGVYGQNGTTGAQATINSTAGGVIITYVYKVVPGNGSAVSKLEPYMGYSDCFKWGYAKDIFILKLSAKDLAALSPGDFSELPYQQVLQPAVHDLSGRPLIFTPITTAYPVALPPNTQPGNDTTLRGCKCAAAWQDVDGNIYAGTCATNVDTLLNATISWCPVDPTSCPADPDGWDICPPLPTNITLPNAPGACTAGRFVPACRGLITVSNSTEGDVDIHLPTNLTTLCTRQLSPSDQCFIEIAKVVSYSVQCPDQFWALGIANDLMNLAEKTCAAHVYKKPANLAAREALVPRQPATLCPSGLDGDPLGYLTATSGTITNIGSYVNFAECSWVILPPSDHSVITLTTTSFDTEPSYDYVAVYDGEGLVGKYSGRQMRLGPNVTTTTGVLVVEFISDDDIQGKGFNLTWAAHPSLNPRPTCPPGTAVGASVVESLGFGSDISWVLAQGPELAGPTPRRALMEAEDYLQDLHPTRRALLQSDNVTVVAWGGNTPVRNSDAGRAFAPYFPKVPALYTNLVRTTEYGCIAPGNYTLYMFSPLSEGWGPSVLKMYAGDRMLVRANLSSTNASFATMDVVVPPLDTFNPNGNPPASGPYSYQFALRFNGLSGSDFQNPLVRYATREVLALGLGVVINDVEAGARLYDWRANAVYITYEVVGLPDTSAVDHAAALVRDAVMSGGVKVLLRAEGIVVDSVTGPYTAILG